jgi:hypothetical protein
LLCLRLPRNLFLNRLENPVAHIAPIVSGCIFVQVGLQIPPANRVIDASHPALDEAPEALYGVRVDIAHHVNFGRVVDTSMGVAERLAIPGQLL